MSLDLKFLELYIVLSVALVASKEYSFASLESYKESGIVAIVAVLDFAAVEIIREILLAYSKSARSKERQSSAKKSYLIDIRTNLSAAQVNWSLKPVVEI